MRINIVFLVLFFSSTLFAQKVGDWRLHFRYENSIDLAVTPSKVYSATDKALLVYDKQDGSLRTMDKANALSDIGIAGIDYAPVSDAVIVVYNSSNIDLIKGNTVINLPDIKNKQTAGSKTIHEVYVDSAFAYLSTDLGIVVIDLDNEEIDNTYVIGSAGNPTPVYDCTIVGDSIFAVTLQGLKKSNLDNENLLDFENWTHIPTQSFDFIETFDDTLYAAKDSTVWQYNDGIWGNIYAEDSTEIQSLTASDLLTFTTYALDTSNNVVNWTSLEKNGGEWDTIYTEGSLRPTIVWKEGGVYFVADYARGLQRFENQNRDWLLPSGFPFGNTSYRMSSYGDRVFVSAGLYDNGLNPQYNSNGMYYFQNNAWANVNVFLTEGLFNVTDMSFLEYNPTDGNLYIGSADGLVKYNFETAEVYDFSNSILDTITQGFSNDRTLIMGVDVDAQGNVWMVNSQAPDPLAVKTINDEWYKFDLVGDIKKYNNLFIDSYGQKWVTLAGEGVFVYDEGDILESAADDQVVQLAGGSIHNRNVHAIVEDREGEIWIGTDEGIAVFDCPRDVMDFSSGCAASRQIKSTLDIYTEYLFETDIV
ncbi:MAG: two-component regulator propeller domain-containing protein, partial [Chitinophagales bacterium]